MKLPKARTENLLEQNLVNETLIYDLLIDKAFNLNETLTIVYKACGQNQTFEDLKLKHKFTDDFIYLALDELKRNNLLKDEYASPFDGTNRREVIKKVGLATMMALPIITGLVAPRAANAASGGSDPAGGSGNSPTFTPSQLGGICEESRHCAVGLCSQTTKRCCFPENQGHSGQAIMPGESKTIFYDASDYPNFLELPVQTTGDFCPKYVYCCSGDRSSGSCTYTQVGEETTGADGVTRYGNFSYSCTCTCPA